MRVMGMGWYEGSGYGDRSWEEGGWVQEVRKGLLWHDG